jgi:hypothetical protein
VEFNAPAPPFDVLRKENVRHDPSAHSSPVVPSTLSIAIPSSLPAPPGLRPGYLAAMRERNITIFICWATRRPRTLCFRTICLT